MSVFSGCATGRRFVLRGGYDMTDQAIVALAQRLGCPIQLQGIGRGYWLTDHQGHRREVLTLDGFESFLRAEEARQIKAQPPPQPQ
jgi:hypothetical protein